MKRTLPWLLLLSTAPLLAPGTALAWASANRFGGSSFRTWGAGGHSNAFGGSTVHVDGMGTEHTNAWGGDTAHGWYGGTEHTDAYGRTTYGVAAPAYGGYPAYHPPVAVPYYGATGCYGCAAAAGALVGASAAAVGASAATAAAAPVMAPPVAVGGSTVQLPPGAVEVSRGGAVYYISGTTWYQPVYGANGVFYQVVPAP